MSACFKKIFRSRRGLGLLETIVALSILITGIVTLMALVVSASIAQSLSVHETIGSNLAREGIEVVVAKRNDNWINNLPFDSGLTVGTDYAFGLSFDPIINGWTFVNIPGTGEPNSLSDDLAKVYQYDDSFNGGKDAGLYVQGTVSGSPPAGTDPTIFRRLVTVDPICVNDTDGNETIVTSGSACGSGTTKRGGRITSAVQWAERNRTHDVKLVETVYDWR